MITIDFLDKVLIFLKDQGDAGYSFTKDCPSYFSYEEFDRYLKPALEKLCRDNFAYFKVQELKMSSRKVYYISIDGIFALLENHNKPYKKSICKKRLVKFWNVTKIIAVAINAIIVLYYTVRTYYKD
ncbi:hypothetical protein [Chryseobacterium salviniae]|uniref:Uncharacterized protein n=1 Tax=Chryseobacterium salviniae TaxID=3101750 RepID=A0ABU6HSS7_9FLAO|nr:hypothetical protein [Chryseobacterium sp. T9W2-O]MEC3875958.1 hypothetical protein [Chryseobacterium sp. T9W2-O]